jgi:hypothetical protein
LPITLASVEFCAAVFVLALCLCLLALTLESDDASVELLTDVC